MYINVNLYARRMFLKNLVSRNGPISHARPSHVLTFTGRRRKTQLIQKGAMGSVRRWVEDDLAIL